jgi:RNA-directed DNA polymerase
MSRLINVRLVASKDKAQQFTSLYHHLTPQLLRESFMKLSRKSAPGVDGITWVYYASNLDDNILSVHRLLINGSYRPKPARMKIIPKEDGSERHISIQCVEDKIVQMAVVEVLNGIYEEAFLGFSYGFRPKRSQHMALDALCVAIKKKKVNWVLDMDISKFFDTVEHGWLIKFIRHRIRDPRILRLITQWIKVGTVDDSGRRVPATIGTPQGSVISPLLANIYLHYVFDLWVNQYRRRYMVGTMTVVRYADDAVLGFQKKAEAEQFMAHLGERLGSFGLTLHPVKTKLIRFGRYAPSQVQERPWLGRVGTFDFLGFTHYIGLQRNGEYGVMRKTMCKRQIAQLKRIRLALRWRLHDNPHKTAKWLRSVVQGHINYFGVPFNSRAVGSFVDEVKKAWLKSLRRRSQRSKMNWQRFNQLIQYWIPKPRVVHPYPEQRFYAIYPR